MKDLIRSFPAPLVSYCITNYNRSLVDGREYLPLLIDDLMQDAPQNCELVLTDWYSVDKPVREWLPRTWDKGLQIIDMDGKFSVSQGRFVGCERANGKYIFVLDADMKIPKGFTEKIISNLEEEAEVCFPYYYDEQEDGSIWPTEEEVKQFIIDDDPANRGQGNHMFKKSIWPFLRLGYWEVLERTEWGYEDHVIYWRSQQLDGGVWRGWIKDFIHQWHPREGSFYG
jgi:hypothetical protein